MAVAASNGAAGTWPAGLGSPCSWLVLAAWATVLVLFAPGAQLQLPALSGKRAPLTISPIAAGGGGRVHGPGGRATAEQHPFCPPIPPDVDPQATAAPQEAAAPTTAGDDADEGEESQFTSMLTVERDFFLRLIATKVQCQVVRLQYPDWPRPDTDVCVYSSNDDPHVSRHIHAYGQWIPQLDIAALLSLGPCSHARPFVMVVGTGVGIVPLAAALQGCHVIAFEPWSGNFGRTVHGLMLSGVLRCVSQPREVGMLACIVGRCHLSTRVGWRRRVLMRYADTRESVAIGAPQVACSIYPRTHAPTCCRHPPPRFHGPPTRSGLRDALWSTETHPPPLPPRLHPPRAATCRCTRTR
jgi:hypothetical protein